MINQVFTMPGLSAYEFNMRGEVYNKSGFNVSEHKLKGGYYLVHDSGGKHRVNRAEIIAYGKHLSHVHVDGMPCGYIKLQSKANTLCETERS